MTRPRRRRSSSATSCRLAADARRAPSTVRGARHGLRHCRARHQRRVRDHASRPRRASPARGHRFEDTVCGWPRSPASPPPKHGPPRHGLARAPGAPPGRAPRCPRARGAPRESPSAQPRNESPGSRRRRRPAAACRRARDEEIGLAHSLQALRRARRRRRTRCAGTHLRHPPSSSGRRGCVRATRPRSAIRLLEYSSPRPGGRPGPRAGSGSRRS